MLELKNITKSYTTGSFTQVALDNVSLKFRKSEFVAILGQSGSGKTTCLNVIGGLDRYDSGDLVINEKSTKDFSDKEWDAYRNNSVGFIFQSYNLITHLSIVDNVELGMTLSGIGSAKKHESAISALNRVGLSDHIHKKPNQLSGGQMQRVAIARALANNPDIILADEPTGALDTQTSISIMELIKDIAKDKLVIMVTHNPELAHKYADRIVEFCDGKIISDTNPFEQESTDSNYTLKKTSMSFLTALKLSFKNISTKKLRTALTSFASSIGIIGIALILSLSNGFQIQIDKFQSDALSEFPVTVGQNAMVMNEETIKEMSQMRPNANKDYADTDEVILYDPMDSSLIHTNVLSKEYLDYIKNIDTTICTSIGYTRMVNMNLIRKTDDKIFPVSIAIGMNSSQTAGPQAMTSMSGVGLSSYPKPLDGQDNYLEKNYDVLSGSYPKSKNEIVLVVDNQNKIDYNVMKNLGFDTQDLKSIDFKEIVGTTLSLVTNNDYYVKTDMSTFVPSTDYDKMYNSDQTVTLTISGILRLKKDVKIGLIGSGIAYSDELVEFIADRESKSEIVNAQRESDNNIFTTEQLDESSKASMITYLGGDATPVMMYIYPKDFESKNLVLDYLDKFNNGKDEADMVIYSDLAESLTNMTSGIMDAITIVLIAFAAISLIVSLIMIGIITYISVLERTKEIGILRALGARKKDITRVFNAETFIIGICSDILGIIIAGLLTIPVNSLIYSMTDLSGVAKLNPIHAVILVTISVLLTLLGGYIPSKMAAKKDPVEALRSE